MGYNGKKGVVMASLGYGSVPVAQVLSCARCMSHSSPKGAALQLCRDCEGVSRQLYSWK